MKAKLFKEMISGFPKLIEEQRRREAVKRGQTMSRKPDVRFVWMDSTDFESEIGPHGPASNKIYPTKEACQADSPCTINKEENYCKAIRVKISYPAN